MEYSKEDVERLIDVATHLVTSTDEKTSWYDELVSAVLPFREPKPARVTHLNCQLDPTSVSDGVPFIEAIDAVKARLSPTAGVSTLSINNLMDNHRFSANNTAGQTRMIQKLIARSAPDIEGDL